MTLVLIGIVAYSLMIVLGIVCMVHDAWTFAADEMEPLASEGMRHGSVRRLPSSITNTEG